MGDLHLGKSLGDFDLTEDGTINLTLEQVMLMHGRYTLDFAIECDLGIPVDYFREAVSIEFYSDTDDVGCVKILHEWTL